MRTDFIEERDFKTVFETWKKKNNLIIPEDAEQQLRNKLTQKFTVKKPSSCNLTESPSLLIEEAEVLPKEAVLKKGSKVVPKILGNSPMEDVYYYDLDILVPCALYLTVMIIRILMQL